MVNCKKKNSKKCCKCSFKCDKSIEKTIITASPKFLMGESLKEPSLSDLYTNDNETSDILSNNTITEFISIIPFDLTKYKFPFAQIDNTDGITKFNILQDGCYQFEYYVTVSYLPKGLQINPNITLNSNLYITTLIDGNEKILEKETCINNSTLTIDGTPSYITYTNVPGDKTKYELLSGTSIQLKLKVKKNGGILYHFLSNNKNGDEFVIDNNIYLKITKIECDKLNN